MIEGLVRRLAPLALGISLLLVGGTTAVAQQGPPPPGPPYGGPEEDTFNLGLLGGEAQDPERPKPQVEDMGDGRKRIKKTDAPDIVDPLSLRVTNVFEKGPLAKAKVRVGDLIVGAPEPFTEDGCLTPLADALIEAEGGNGRLVLLIERDGEREEVKVKIEKGGKEALDPSSDAHRTAVLEAAAEWLAEAQQPEGGFHAGTGGGNGNSCLAAQAGLVWLALGSDLKRGKYKKNVAAALDCVVAAVEAGPVDEAAAKAGWAQTHWRYAFAGLFLGELHARKADAEVAEALHACAQHLCDGQAESGGWAHGPGGANALGYVELNILAGLAMSAIGLAEQAGFEVPKGVISGADDYLKSSAASDGGIAYAAGRGSHAEGNVGRTAGCWLGYKALGIAHSPFGKRMGEWLVENAGAYERGHSTLVLHIALGGLAAHTTGGTTTEAFWKVARRDLTLARTPDGSLRTRPYTESYASGGSSDLRMGIAWTTCCWALAIAADEGKDRVGLPALRGDLVTKRRSITDE